MIPGLAQPLAPVVLGFDIQDFKELKKSLEVSKLETLIQLYFS